MRLTKPSRLKVASGLLAILAAGALPASTSALAGEPVETLASRSQLRLPELASFDGRVAEAIAGKSLPALQRLYAELHADSDAADARQAARKVVTGCDLAVSGLLVIVGFAINKLDGAGRYQDWMLDESLTLVEATDESMRDCAHDAGAPSVTPRLTAQLLKAL